MIEDKYPKIQREKLDFINRRKFRGIKASVSNIIWLDNDNNKLGLSQEDIDLLSWNIATDLITNRDF